jgi:DNA-binding MarR family transcriptional regulator
MTEITARNAAKQDFMPLMRALVRAYQAFASFDASLHRANGTGLTVSQADVIFTLGNTPGMTCGEIGERTLITKGTLTGVIDRLADKGLVRREPVRRDGRCTRIVLTAAGERAFEAVFPEHVRKLKERFDRISPEDRVQAIRLLGQVQEIFSA